MSEELVFRSGEEFVGKDSIDELDVTIHEASFIAGILGIRRVVSDKGQNFGIASEATSPTGKRKQEIDIFA